MRRSLVQLYDEDRRKQDKDMEHIMDTNDQRANPSDQRRMCVSVHCRWRQQLPSSANRSRRNGQRGRFDWRLPGLADLPGSMDATGKFARPSRLYAPRRRFAGFAIRAWRRAYLAKISRRFPPAVGSAWTALGLLLVQIALSGAVALELIPGAAVWLSLAHLLLSLLALAASTTAAVLSFYPRAGRLVFPHPVCRRSLAALALLFILMLSGSLVQSIAAQDACPGWPLCGPGLLSSVAGRRLHMAHRLIVALAAVLMARLFMQAWKTSAARRRSWWRQPPQQCCSLPQALLGAKLVQVSPLILLGVHQATAAAAGPQSSSRLLLWAFLPAAHRMNMQTQPRSPVERAWDADLLIAGPSRSSFYCSW